MALISIEVSIQSNSAWIMTMILVLYEDCCVMTVTGHLVSSKTIQSIYGELQTMWSFIRSFMLKLVVL